MCVTLNFSSRQFHLVHDDPSTFIACQWQKDKTIPNRNYLIYRVTVALLFLVTCFYSVYYEGYLSIRCLGFWMIYLTHWGYLMCTIQAMSAAIMISVNFISTNAGTKCLKMYPVYWLTHTIATPMAFFITGLFWCAVYEPEAIPFDAHNYFVHANNSFMMFVDIWMVAHPTNFAHIIYPLFFSIIYMLFTILYHLAGGRTSNGEPYIYKILDWDEPRRTWLICAGALVLLLLVYVLVYLLSKTRKKLHDKYFIQEGSVE